MAQKLLTALNWAMLIMSITGFARLIYLERWGRAFIASILAGVSLYTMLFL